jgi:hypothetical protein
MRSTTLRSMNEILRRQNSTAISRHICPASLLGVPVGYCQRGLVDESGMIRTQIGNAQCDTM